MPGDGELATATKATVVFGAELPWIPSPTRGVERRMLQRDGGEVARATTIVRYAPGAVFPRHVHARGEEFFVLRGVFSDEHGDYPRGTYVRSPWDSRHQPFSERGCEIFVKLRQLPRAAERLVVAPAEATHSLRTLFADATERVAHVRLRSGEPLPPLGEGLAEALVVSGGLTHREQYWPAQTWLRLAGLDSPIVAAVNTELWIKHTR